MVVSLKEEKQLENCYENSAKIRQIFLKLEILRKLYIYYGHSYR